MNKSDWSVLAVILEAVDVLAGFFYIGLQIFYGILYHVEIYHVILNLLVGILVYAGLTLLAVYPERMNHLPEERCTGKVRIYSLRMIRGLKFIFVAGLLVPCICDVAAVELPNIYNVCMIFLMLGVAVYYEVRIIQNLKS